MSVNERFLMSTENECLTTLAGADAFLTDRLHDATFAFLQELGRASPSIPDVSAGIFNSYGRVYIDTGGHLEFAAIECDQPHMLPLVIEQQYALVRAANERFVQACDAGGAMVLANNNHSGPFTTDASLPIWGSHENYLLEDRPPDLAELMLPFLATRVYAGAGVIEHPSGRYLAGVRAAHMELDVGGGTTESRAIYSTSRDEPLTSNPTFHRLHLICGDGHRSHFNITLQFGATALVLKAVSRNRSILDRLPHWSRPHSKRPWCDSMRAFNILAEPGGPLRVHPRAVQIQRIYLDAALDYACALDHPPAWIERTLLDWDQTLTAMETGNQAWLARRLDAWAKYELFSAVIADAGTAWQNLRNNQGLSFELALLNQNYHEFTDPNSVFCQLEASGMLQHRIGETIPPGAEPDPFIPNTTTRAAARARFIRDRASSAEATITWSYAVDEHGVWTLDHPFASEFSADKSARRRRRSRHSESMRQTLYVEDLLRRCEEF